MLFILVKRIELDKMHQNVGTVCKLIVPINMFIKIYKAAKVVYNYNKKTVWNESHCFHLNLVYMRI